MKKNLLIVALVVASYSFSNAQEIGIRFGDVSAGPIAIDGVFSTGDFNRIHADLSFGDGVGIDVLWDFLYKPLGEEAFNWYVGVGPYIQIDDPFWFGAAGEIGLEYKFAAVPIAIGIDWRPTLSIIEETDLHANGFGINVRWRIGE
ncbi:MAG: outer membrane insertion C- signal [Bacteroidetes bacterium]|nr:outer membrane insertion C- signal [Bacteroidota bacterium]